MNRYEHLFGYNYRRLVDSLSEKFSDKNEITVASVLLFKSFNENLYYISSPINPLLYPEQVTKENLQKLLNKKHYSPLCLWYLASYFCTNEGIAMIENVFYKENKRLVDANASTFDLTFTNFNKLKNKWINWLQANKKNDWGNPPVGEDVNSNQIINQCFVLANFLLILMPITINHNEISRENNASSIYKAVMGKNEDFIYNPWTTRSGKFRVLQNKIQKWKFIQNKEHSFGPLLDVIEFVLLHPLPSLPKESVMKTFTENRRINKTYDFNFRSYNFSVMAYPLLYNAEFQGIVYITKYGNTAFTNDDRKHFESIIKDNKFESRLADSKYDLALIAMKGEKISFEEPPLLRILSNLHHFTSASCAIAVVEDEKGNIKAEEVYRDSNGTGIEMLNHHRDDGNAIKALIEKEVILDNRHTAYLFKDCPTLSTLLSLPKNGEKHTAKSALVLSIEIDEKPQGFLILFYEEVNQIVNQFCFNNVYFGERHDSRDLFAERIHNTVIRLVDADNEHRKILDILKEIKHQNMRDLELMTPHKIANSFEPRLISPLKTVVKLIDNQQAKDKVSATIKFLDRFATNAKKISTIWRTFYDFKHTNDLEKLIISNKKLLEILNGIQKEKKDKLGLIQHNLDQFKKTILTSPEIFAELLELLIENTIEVYEEKQTSLENRTLKIEFNTYSTFADSSQDKINRLSLAVNDENIVIVSIWNSNTQFTPAKLKHAGLEPFNNNPKRTGVGFCILQSWLFQLEAIKLDKERHFKLENTESPIGARVNLGFRCN